MDVELVLENEKNKALSVLKEYNNKYKNLNNVQLINALNYLLILLENEHNVEIKKILQEDINIINEYL
jgi:hypothetical protein